MTRLRTVEQTSEGGCFKTLGNLQDDVQFFIRASSKNADVLYVAAYGCVAVDSRSPPRTPLMGGVGGGFGWEKALLL